jgi:hypothetical protein
MIPAPIIAFIYNRPAHTRRMLESLSTNILASESILYIFADGIKNDASENDKKLIRQTREIAKSRKWCKEVHIRESEINRGLADSIVAGVSEIVNEYGKVIVLEDDLILSEGFLKYMNDALHFYENKSEVMHISGYVYPIDAEKLAEQTFFYEQASCWGWATWKRAWQYFESDAESLAKKIEKIPNGISRFNLDNTYNFFETIIENINGRKKTWAVKWQASVFLQNGLCLHPRISLVNNTGNDGTGVHKGFTNKYLHKKLASSIEITPISLEISHTGKELVKEFLSSRIPQKSIIPISIRKKIASLLPDFIKKWIINSWSN